MIETSSNIVFSNGLLDPSHGTGVLQNISDTVVAVIIPEGAHHLDVSVPSAAYSAVCRLLRQCAACCLEIVHTQLAGACCCLSGCLLFERLDSRNASLVDVVAA